MAAPPAAAVASSVSSSGRKPVEMPAPDTVMENFSKQWQNIAMAPTTNFWVVLIAEGLREEMQVSAFERPMLQ